MATTNPTRTQTLPRVETQGCARRDDEATLTVKDVADASGLPQPVIAQLVPRQWVDGAGWMYTRQGLDRAVEIGGELREQAWDHVMKSSAAIPTSNA